MKNSFERTTPFGPRKSYKVYTVRMFNTTTSFQESTIKIGLQNEMDGTHKKDERPSHRYTSPALYRSRSVRILKKKVFEESDQYTWNAVRYYS
jgi:hypothetical protein